MDWGTFFEPVHRDILQLELGCTIHESSMCKGSGILLGCHQSPDGLAVVKSDIFKSKVFIDDLVNKQCLQKPFVRVLFEQKSPYYRKPLHKGVPDHYIG